MTSRPMNVPAVQRQLRQIALPEVGPAGQQRLAGAVVAIAAGTASAGGDDLVAETAARYLGAAGVGTLRLVGGAHDGAGLLGSASPSLTQSNPDVIIERAEWPADGAAWMAALSGVDLIVRSGFDDDAMLRAAVRLGIPAVVARAAGETAELIAFRQHGPCPHAALDIPPRAADSAGAGPAAVVAGTMAAAEAILMLVAQNANANGEGGGRPGGRARHLAVPLDGGEPRAQPIPWSPECFACGGAGTEMSFS